MPIRKCIQSAINLSDSDVESVMSGYESYVKGMDSDAAALLAIDDVIVSAQSERSELLALINEQYPEAQVTEAPAQPMEADAEPSLNPEEQSEYDQAVAKGLDMSEEARMKRARDMGFDTETVYYHGTDVKNITEFRAGTAQGWGKGVYLTDNKKATEEFGDIVIEAYLKIKNPFDGNAYSLNDVDVENTEIFKSMDKKTKADYDDETNFDWNEEFAENGKFAGELLRELGFDGIIADQSNSIDGLEVVVFDPKNIRSVNAAFDPSYKDSADLLARQDEVDEVPYESTIVKPQAIIRANERVETDQPVQPGDFVQHSPQPKTVSKNSIGIESLDKLARELRTNNPGLDNVKFNIFETQDEAFGPGSVAKNGVIKGGFNSGSNDLILIAENLRNTPDAMMVIRHEMVGHFGFRSLLNKDGAFDKLLGRIYKARTGEMKEQYDWVAKHYPSLIANNEARTIADEMLARSAETETKSNFVKYIYDQIIKLLNQFKLTRGAVTQSEINSLVRSSATNLRKPVRTSRDSFQTNDGQTLMSREEQSEYDRAVAKGLDMSQEARMKRAKDMGFNVLKKFYHGTGSDFKEFSDDFIGTATDQGTDGKGFYFSDDPESGSGNAEYVTGFGDRPGANVMPVFLSYKNPYKVNRSNRPRGLEGNAKAANKFTKGLIKDGYDSVEHTLMDGSVVVNIFEPSQIRSVNAAFDPDFKDSGNLLASRGEQSIKDFESSLKADLGLKTLSIFESKESLVLNTIIVPKSDRKKGIGTRAMEMITEYADSRGMMITLSPAIKDDFQGVTSRARLVKFYKQFGFVENKGRNKDFSISNSMYREPKEILSSNNESQGQNLFRVDDSIDDLPVGPNLGMPEEKLKEKFVRVAQDSFNRVKKMQSTLKEQGGNVSFDGDVYGAEERSSAKISNRLDRIDKDIMNPLLKFMDKNDVTLEQQDEFLMAMHATERNEWIADHRDDMQDGGSGMETQEAKDILNGYSPERRAVLEEAASFVYAINRQYLSDLVEGGHLTQEVSDSYSDRWDFYVPLKGKEGQESRPSTGVGFGITGSGIIPAMGRGADNRAESPTAHSFAQAQSAVVRTEKTKVGQALIQLIRDNPDPNFWTISQRNYNKFVDMFGEPFEGYDEAPAGLIENLDYKPVMNSEGKIVYRLNPGYKNRDDVFPVMVEGQELLVQIEDKVLMEQLKRMNITQLNIFVRGFGTVNRYLAMINTALNPEFVITNFERDFQTAMVNLGGEHSAAIAARVAKSIPSAIRGIAQSTFDMEGQSEWRALYEEMREEGGTIGFFGLEDIDTQVKKIQNRLVNRHGVLGRSKRGIASVRDFILDANLSVENAARLASYKVIKDESIANGLSEKEAKGRAASVAKNLTVNFNRKGEWAPVLNSTYLFYNASIQGSARIFTALENPRVRRIVGGIVAMSFALAMYNRSAGGDDDDGIPHWDKIGDYEKQTNLIFMNSDGSGRRTTIRLPYGYNVFSYAGSAMHDLMYNPRRSVAQTTSNILSATLNAFNPIQGADLADTITPTFLKPYMQDVRNMNFMGSPIKPENPFDNYDRPESQKSFKSTNPTLVDMMEAINAETGGDQTHSGLIDISPEIVNHYISWLTGGAGMTATRALSTATNLATGEPIDTRNIPFVRSFVKEPGSFFDTERFYTAIREVNAVEAQLRMLKFTDEYGDYKAKNMEVHKLALHVNRYKNKISRLRDEQDKAYADEDTVLADEKREEMRQEMMEFSLKYDEAIMAQE
jgi:GNAT superfamily N-acetyltransferase/alpha-D-ribose 1-methylphosphonate 5-triphosphate synthase subunit PhnG